MGTNERLKKWAVIEEGVNRGFGFGKLVCA